MMKKLFTSLILLIVGVMVVQSQSLSVGDKTIDLTKDGTYSVGGGTATFTKSNSTLTLKNVSLSNASISGNKIGTSFTKRFYIELESDLTIKLTSNGQGMRFDYSYVVINGNGHKISIDNSAVTGNYSCIDAEESELDIWNARLDFKGGGGSCIWGNSSEGVLALVCIYGDFKGSAGAIKGFKSVLFDDCLLFTNGSKYVAGTGVVNASGTLLTELTVRPKLMVDTKILRTEMDTSKEGVATWNKSTKTLTLSSSFKATSGFPCIANYGVDGLVIKFDEARELTSQNANCIELYKPTTFTGSGKVTINTPSNNTGIYPKVADAAITIDGCNFVINGGYGIDGSGSTSERTDLTINNSTLTVTATKTAMARLKSVTLSGCCVNTAETPVFFNSSQQGFTDISGTWTDKVVIGKPTNYYTVLVNGMRVNNLNQTNILVDGLTEGKMRYVDYDTYGYFELNKVALTSTKSEAIRFNDFSKPITIRCDGGTSTINQSNNDAIYGVRCPKIRFEGDNKLVVNVTTSNSAIRLYKTNLEVDLKGLDVTSAGYGINAVSYEEEVKLAMRTSSTVYNINGTGGSLSYKTLTLDGLDFDANATPGCYAGTKSVCQNGGAVVNTNIRFSVPITTYGLTVAGTPVNNCNMKGIGSQYITAGGGTAAVFDGSKLTLNGATIDCGNDIVNPIRNTGVSGLTVELKGENVFKDSHSGYAGDNCAFYTKVNTTVTGSGSLDATANKPIMVAGGTFTFKDAKEIKAKSIQAQNETCGAKLVVNNSNVTFNGSVSYFDDVTWPNGKLLTPADGYYDTAQKRIVDGSGVIAKKVVFGDKTATGIEGVEVDTDAEVIGIYDAQGRKLDEMQPGINIIRMSNGTTRKVVK